MEAIETSEEITIMLMRNEISKEEAITHIAFLEEISGTLAEEMINELEL